MLADHADLVVVDDVVAGQDALTRLGNNEIDVVVMEVRLPDMSGIEVLRRIRTATNHPVVLFLTTVNDPAMLLAAAKAGAAGYVLKDISPENLANAIRAVHNGRTMIHPELARGMFERLQVEAQDTPRTRIPGLQDVDISILSGITLGLSDREIAAKLYLSEATVKKHLRNIYTRLGVRNRAQAALLAIRNRLIK